MSNKVHEVFCDYIDFNFLIIEVSEIEIEEVLLYFGDEGGMVPKVYYDDFIVAKCMANANQIIHKTASNADIDRALLREIMIDEVLVKNPALSYDNIVLVEEAGKKLLKLRSASNNESPSLADNSMWDFDPTNPADFDIKLGVLDDAEDTDEIIPIEDIPFTTKEKWWDLLGIYVKIKVYDEKYLSSLFNEKYFHSSISFNTCVVTLCVENYEELVTLLDVEMRGRIAPPFLVKELYGLCLKCNPFLTLENAQILYDKNYEPDVKGLPPAGSTAASMNTMEQFTKQQEKTRQKTFAEVPEEELLNLGNNMKVSLIGQDKAVDSIVEAIQRASVGLKDPAKPIGSFLFAGPTGTGKTLASKVLADELIKSRDNLITIDCSEYSADHEYAKLIGAPNGYTGFEQGGVLTNAVIENPFSVVVFDEIEKASFKIYQLLLQVFEEGRLTDNKGTKVSFKDTVIILTSNLGVDEINKVKGTIGFGDANQVTEEKKEKAIEKALKKKFKPEFLNRIDEVVYFNDLSEDDYMRIVDIELYKLNDNLQSNNTKYKTIELMFDEKIRKFVFEEGIDKEYGARPLKRTIEKTIATPLAVELLRGNLKKDATVKISTASGKPTFTSKKKEVKQVAVKAKEDTST